MYAETMWRYRLKRRVHTSWVIALMSFGVVVGAAMSQWLYGWHVPVVIAMGVFGVVCVMIWPRVVMLGVALGAGLLIGLWRGSVAQHELSVYAHLYGAKVTTQGTVSDDPDTNQNGQLVIRLKGMAIDGHPLAGQVWVTATTKYDIKRGDTVKVRGKLTEGFGTFAAKSNYATVLSVQRPQPGDVARVARDWFGDAVRRAIHEPASALGLGYLLGQKRALPDDLTEALKIAGLTHVVVASGYNLTILVRLARRLFSKVSKYVSMLAASTMILGFMAVTGASPSMSRAGLVAGVSLAAWYYGRTIHPLVLIPFAAAVTVLVDPSYAWNDLGWQLSFAAFAGVIIMAPLGQRYFFGDKEPGTVRQILGETVAAHIVTLPILIMAFGYFSNVAVISNLLVLPFVPLAMLLTFIAGVTALVAPGIAQIVGLPAQWLLDYMIAVTKYLAGLPWAQTEFQAQWWMVVVAYIVMMVMCWWMARAVKFSWQKYNVVE